MNKNKETTVLIVDDNAQNRKIISSYLKKENFSVFEAQNADEAFSFLGVVVPDAILMDYQMPGMDGLKTIELIREKNLRSVIIMMTAYTSQEVIIGAIRSQADDFLSKPLDFKSLGNLIIKTIEKRFSTYSFHTTKEYNENRDEELFSSLICSKNGKIFLNYTTDENLSKNIEDNTLEKFSNLINSNQFNKNLIETDSEIFDLCIGNLHFIIKKEENFQMFFILNDNQYQWAVQFDILNVFHELLNDICNKCNEMSESDDKSLLLSNLIENKLVKIIDNLS